MSESMSESPTRIAEKEAPAAPQPQEPNPTAPTLVLRWSDKQAAAQPQWSSGNASTAANCGNGNVVVIDFTRRDEQRLAALEAKVAANAGSRTTKQATNGGGGSSSHPGDEDDGNADEFEKANVSCAAAREASPLTVVGAPALTAVEEAELLQLRAKYEEFCREGERRLLQGAQDRQRMISTGDRGAGWGEWMGNVASAVGSGAKAVGSAGFFWGSLVATAVPGYVGRKAGLTTGFAHWNWVGDRLVLGAIPVATQVGSSGNHLEQLKAQIAARAAQNDDGTPSSSRPLFPLGLVVACLNEEEITGYGLPLLEFCGEPHWRRVFGDDLEYVRVPMPDMTADTELAPVIHAVDRMQHVMHVQKQTVYVHCKAGKGRSWMVVMCFLTAVAGMDYESAALLLQTCRHQVHPSTAQQQFARTFAARYTTAKLATPQ